MINDNNTDDGGSREGDSQGGGEEIQGKREKSPESHYLVGLAAVGETGINKGSLIGLNG